MASTSGYISRSPTPIRLAPSKRERDYNWPVVRRGVPICHRQNVAAFSKPRMGHGRAEQHVVQPATFPLLSVKICPGRLLGMGGGVGGRNDSGAALRGAGGKELS